MAGTIAVACKRALFTRLATRPRLKGVQLAYSWPGNVERECVYGGGARSTQEYAAASPGRKPRNETALVDVHIYVRLPGGDVEAADVRAMELGVVVEEELADDVTLGGLVPGHGYGGVASIDGDYMQDDDAVTAIWSYQLRFRSFYIR